MDLIQAAEFWNNQESGLGLEFLNFILPEIDQLKATAGMHRKTGKYHRAVILGRFPYYSIYYQLNEGFAEVFAVIDTRRNPRWVQNLLRRRRRA